MESLTIGYDPDTQLGRICVEFENYELWDNINYSVSDAESDVVGECVACEDMQGFWQLDPKSLAESGCVNRPVGDLSGICVTYALRVIHVPTGQVVQQICASTGVIE